MGGCCATQNPDDIPLEDGSNFGTALGRKIENTPTAKFESYKRDLTNRLGKLERARIQLRDKSRALGMVSKKEEAYFLLTKIKEIENYKGKANLEIQEIERILGRIDNGEIEDDEAWRLEAEKKAQIDRDEQDIDLFLESEGTISKENALTQLDGPEWEVLRKEIEKVEKL